MGGGSLQSPVSPSVSHVTASELDAPLVRAKLLARARLQFSPDEVEELRDAMIRGDWSSVAAWKVKIEGEAEAPTAQKIERRAPQQGAPAARITIGRSRPAPAFHGTQKATPPESVSSITARDASPVAENAAPSPEAIAMPDVETLRATVEEIREEIGTICNSLTLVLCEEYTREYLPIYHDIQHHYLHGDLTQDQILAFARRLEDLKAAAEAVAEKMGVLEKEGSAQSIFGKRDVEVPVTEVSVPPVDSAPSTESEIVPVEESSNATSARPGMHDIVPPDAKRSEAPMSADLYTPEMDRQLEALLHDWLGTTGFLGIGGASGRRHPEFLALRDMPMERLLRKDYAPELRSLVSKKTLRSIDQNIEAWRGRYGIAPDTTEDFEHYVRRVIAASATA